MLFHITTKFLGKSVIFEPRTSAEDLPPRVCFAPTIYQAMGGLPENKFSRNLHIYYTEQELGDISTEYDASVIEERWSLNPIECKYLGSITDRCFLGMVCALLYGDDSGMCSNVPKPLQMAYLATKILILKHYLENRNYISRV